MWVNVYYYNDGFIGSWKVNPEDLVESIKDEIDKNYKLDRDHYDLTIENSVNKKEIRMYDDRPLSDYFHNYNQNITVFPKPLWKIIFIDIKSLLKKRRGYQNVLHSR